MAKKMKYKITERHWIMIDIQNEQEEELLVDLNRDINKTARKEKRHRKRNVSMDELLDLYEYEFASQEDSLLDSLIKEEEERLIRQAVSLLPPRQKFVIIEYFWKNKSLRDIAKENDLHLSTVAESYHSAMSKLGIMLKGLKD